MLDPEIPPLFFRARLYWGAFYWVVAAALPDIAGSIATRWGLYFREEKAAQPEFWIAADQVVTTWDLQRNLPRRSRWLARPMELVFRQSMTGEKIVSRQISAIYMKTRLTLLKFFLFILTGTAYAVPTQFFKSWPELIQESPNIVIVECCGTPAICVQDTNGVTKETPFGAVKSSVEVKVALKGAADALGASVMSENPLRQGEYYLIFGQRYDNYYQAVEPYRVIPLGLTFSTNSLANIALDQQIKILLRLRLTNLNRQMKDEAEEKQRIEQGISK